MKDFVFITGNRHKVEWLEKFLGSSVESKSIDLDEIQDLDHQRVAKLKAGQAYEMLKKPVLIEDTSLKFNALNNLPGTLIKWFVQDLGLSKLAKLLEGFEDKSAEAIVTFCYYDGQKYFFFEGSTDGTISKPKGDFGHGWDPIFTPSGSDKTFGQMEEGEYFSYSPRNKAVIKLKEFLNK